jgi:uncharacterized membrane protein
LNETTSRLARRLRFAVVGSTATLIALVAGWLLAGAPSLANVLIAIAITAPLWLTLPRLAAGSRRSYAWITLAVVPYFVIAITEAVANPAVRTWAGVCWFVGFMLFVLAIAYLRVTRSAAAAPDDRR